MSTAVGDKRGKRPAAIQIGSQQRVDNYLLRGAIFLVLISVVIGGSSLLSYFSSSPLETSPSLDWVSQKSGARGDLVDGSLGKNRDEEHCIDIGKCASPCECAKQNAQSGTMACRNHAGFIDYLKFHYCTMGSMEPLSVIAMIAWGMFLFYLLVSTTEEYFTPALAKLSERLQFSGNVTGVTLLAFGNGGPDLFSSFSALTHGSPHIAFGALLGGGIFVTSVVMGLIFLTTDWAKTGLSRRPFIRDSIFFLIVVIIIFIMVKDETVYLWESSIIVAVYILYIIGVVVARYIYQRTKRKRREALGIVEDNEELFEVSEGLGIEDNADFAAYPMLDEPSFISSLKSWKEDRKYSSGGELLFGLEDKSFKSLVQGWMQHVISSTNWQEKSARSKIFYIFVSPSIFIRNLTIPLVNDGEGSRFFMVANGLFIPVFILVCIHQYTATVPIGSFDLPVAVILLVVGILLAVAIYFSTNQDRPRFFMFLVLIAFIMSSVWMYLISTEIVCLLRALGRICRVSESILGLTVVAWGNSMVDLISNTVMTKGGFTGTAVSACFGAPAFNMLLGIGLALTYMNISTFPKPYIIDLSTHVATVHVAVAVAFLFINILSAMVFIPVTRFSPGKKSAAVFALYLMVLYAAFTTLSILTELNIIFAGNT